MFVTDLSLYPIFARIDALRLHALEDKTWALQNEFEDALIAFDTDLQAELANQYGDADLRRKVAHWHKLVGSTPEDHDADEEMKTFVIDEVERFVSDFETRWGL